jgi:hypothetical protein
MTEDSSVIPPQTRNADEPPEIEVRPKEWHYFTNGTKNGPVSSNTIRSLLNKGEIEPDVQVWRKGMRDWASIRDSDLADLVTSDPPAISSQLIGNGYVWTLAILPLVYGIIDVSIISSNQQAAARSLILGFPYHPTQGLSWQIPFLINMLLASFDVRRLKKAGYSSPWITALGILLLPVYLFVRAKRLKQWPNYAVTWIVMLVLSFLLYASVE